MATSVTVICPECNNRMRASSDYIGRKGRCPSCKALVEITASGDGESIATTYPARDRTEGTVAPGGRTSTDAPAWLSGLLGVLVTLGLYMIVFLPLNMLEIHIGALFVSRGFIPYIIVLVTCWGLAMLVLKFLLVKRQQSYAELELELIPIEIGLQITPSNVDQFLNHLGKLPRAQRASILGRRIQGALEHFKSRNNVPEVQEYLSTQAEIDASGVDSGYTLLRVFIWAVPILGFIGTVMGISGAVSGLSSTLAGGGEIMDGLGQVTTGLSTAFDTTLVALVMAILLLFPTESLRKTEYAMLDRIEAFTNESLLRRMADEHTGTDSDELPDVVKYALESAFQEHQRWLAQWQAQVSELGQVIGADFEQAAQRIQQKVLEDDGDHVAKLSEATRILGGVFEKMQETTLSWHRSEERMAAKFEELFGAAKDLGSSLAESTEFNRDLAKQQAAKIPGVTPDNVTLVEPVPVQELDPADSPPTKRNSGGIFGIFRQLR